MKKIIKNYWLLFAVAGVVVLFDQITKSLVRAHIPFSSYWMPIDWLAPYFRIVHWQNPGAAFGMFQEGGTVFGILAIIVSIFIIIYYPQIPEQEKLMRISLAMQMGGALGNFVDRILIGPVTDFIAVGAFPVFNIADANITVGVVLLLYALWVNERREKKRLEDHEEHQIENIEQEDSQE